MTHISCLEKFNETKGDYKEGSGDDIEEEKNEIRNDKAATFPIQLQPLGKERFQKSVPQAQTVAQPSWALPCFLFYTDVSPSSSYASDSAEPRR